jgi:hypothetical protein
MTILHDVFDKAGKRVVRNGALADGDRLVVKMRMMDSMSGAALYIADRTDAPTREQLEEMRDARNAALSNAWREPAGGNAPTRPLPPQSRDETLAQRDQKLRDAWKG